MSLLIQWWVGYFGELHWHPQNPGICLASPLAACCLVYRKGADAFLVRQSEAAGLGEFIPGASLCFEGLWLVGSLMWSAQRRLMEAMHRTWNTTVFMFSEQYIMYQILIYLISHPIAIGHMAANLSVVIRNQSIIVSTLESTFWLPLLSLLFLATILPWICFTGSPSFHSIETFQLGSPTPCLCLLTAHIPAVWKLDNFFPFPCFPWHCRLLVLSSLLLAFLFFPACFAAPTLIPEALLSPMASKPSVLWWLHTPLSFRSGLYLNVTFHRVLPSLSLALLLCFIFLLRTQNYLTYICVHLVFMSQLEYKLPESRLCYPALKTVPITEPITSKYQMN